MLLQDESLHAKLRQDTVEYIRSHQETFEPFIEDEIFDNYCDRMSRDGVWGGNPELFAISRLHNTNIIIHQQDSSMEIETVDTPTLAIHLRYSDGEHYDALIP